jgi:hypothetical protein
LTESQKQAREWENSRKRGTFRYVLIGAVGLWKLKATGNNLPYAYLVFSDLF